MMLFFSIIMPVYNAERYIRKAIESVLRQSFDDFELILVDDGSTDDSPRICDEYARKDQRVKVIHQKNGGICNARNRGLTESQGRFIGFIDNDDEIDQITLEECKKNIDDCTLDWIKFGKIEVLEREGKVLKAKVENPLEGLYEGEEILKSLLKLRAQGRMTYVWDGFFNAKIIKRNGLKFDTYFTSGNEDIDFCEEYAKYANKLKVLGKCFYKHYTRLGISASSKYSEKKLDSYLYLLKKSNLRYKEYALPYQSSVDYQFIVTKQVLLNFCQKLNDAGNQINRNQKIKKLNELKNRPEMQIYNQMNPWKIIGASYKLYLYNQLYNWNRMNELIWMDRVSRKLVYKIRRKI